MPASLLVSEENHTCACSNKLEILQIFNWKFLFFRKSIQSTLVYILVWGAVQAIIHSGPLTYIYLLSYSHTFSFHTHTFSFHIHIFSLILTYILLSHTYFLLSHTYIFTLSHTYILLSHTYILLSDRKLKSNRLWNPSLPNTRFPGQ